jgi:hypothetical protein
LLSYGLTCVMPTAIDELRIEGEERRDLPVQESSWGLLGRRRLATLDDRWPLPGPIEELLYSPISNEPQNAAPNHNSILSLEYWNAENGALDAYVHEPSELLAERVDVILSVLEQQIQFQISSRDHFFVAVTRGLIVFRPLFDEGEYSRGVQAEIWHWSLIGVAESKRIIFVHFQKDVDAQKLYYEKDEARRQDKVDRLRAILTELITKKYGLGRPMVRSFLSDIERHSKADILDQGLIPPSTRSKLTKDLPQMQNEVEAIWTGEQLRFESAWHSQSEALKHLAKHIVVEDAADLKRHYSEIAEFLKHD